MEIKQYLPTIVATCLVCLLTVTRIWGFPKFVHVGNTYTGTYDAASPEADGNLAEIKYTQINSEANKLPEMTQHDAIFKLRTAFVIPEYKLIFFTFPKVASSEWKRMFMRMNNNPLWCVRGGNLHDPNLNQISTLHDFDPEIASAIMTSPSWTRAAIFREPKERVLSAFLDKAIDNDYYSQHCCRKLPNVALREQCVDQQEDFASFLHFITEFPQECFDTHWQPQLGKIEEKWWPYIDMIGYQKNITHYSKHILLNITSSREGGEGMSAWERYGASGWGRNGNSKNKCENRTESFMEINHSRHNCGASSQMMDWYTPELEKLVEEHWAIEWSYERVKYPEVKLFEE